jgi:hypothetical protein
MSIENTETEKSSAADLQGRNEALVSTLTLGDEQIRVTITGDIKLIQDWMAHHKDKIEGKGVWQTHLHYWASKRAKKAEIEAVWQGWRKIHVWAGSAFLVRMYKFGLKRGLDVDFWSGT